MEVPISACGNMKQSGTAQDVISFVSIVPWGMVDMGDFLLYKKTLEDGI